MAAPLLPHNPVACQPKIRIRELPLSCQPKTRLEAQGAGVLSDAELLAVAMNAASLDDASRLLAEVGGWTGLQRMSASELQRFGGIGLAKAAQLVAVVEIARRQAVPLPDQRLQVTSPADAARLLQVAIGHQDQEHLVCLCLDTKNRLLKLHTIYIGSVNSAAIRVGEVFKEAVRLNSPAVLIAHNHPSQDVTPSPDDVTVTRVIVQAAKLLDIDCLDHLVVSSTCYTSLREHRLGFSE